MGLLEVPGSRLWLPLNEKVSFHKYMCLNRQIDDVSVQIQSMKHGDERETQIRYGTNMGT